MVEEDEMARLFAAEVEAAFAHPLHHIAVANGGALKSDAGAR